MTEKLIDMMIKHEKKEILNISLMRIAFWDVFKAFEMHS